MSGRTIEFKKNYRNTAHIARAALSLLDKENDKSEFTQVETALKGGTKPENRPLFQLAEQLSNLEWELIKLRESSNIQSTVVLHRSRNGVSTIKSYLDSEGFSTELVKSNLPVNYGSDSVKICTMSSVKGLEFNNVFILDLNDSIIPHHQDLSKRTISFTFRQETTITLHEYDEGSEESLLFSSDKNNPSRYLKEIDPNLLDDISPKSNSLRTSTHDDDLPF